MAVSQEDKNLKPFQDLGFDPAYVSGDERVGACVFCGKSKKLYVNAVTQKWRCMSGACGKSGNLTTFMEEWHALFLESDSGDLTAFAEERGIPVEALEAAEVVYDGERWAIPVRNASGRICNFRFYKPGRKVIGVSTLPVGLYGAETLKDTKTRLVWVCEGEWDAIALRVILKRAKKRALVVAVPGAGTFKDEWAELLAGRDLITAYDHDTDGEKGTRRAYFKLKDLAISFRWLKWPVTLPDKFDVRDFLSGDGSYDGLESLVTEYDAEEEDEEANDPAPNAVDNFPFLKDGGRPTLEETLEPYEENLLMTPDMRDALRIIYAVILSNQIESDPLWVHIVGPPGSAKTVLLESCSEIGSCIYRSTITVHSLVSGFVLSGGRDPSLIPKLYGKAFVLKDFTEVLDMPQAQRYEVYSIFRGAYDGRVEKTFGNGVSREYKGYFSMVTGVTPKLFAEPRASVGERFLLFHMQQGVGFDSSDIVEAACMGVGEESRIMSTLREASKRFLEWRITRDEWPTVSREYVMRLVNLAQLVAMLRGNVERDYRGEQILYRPQHEVGTRLVKQLKKLLMCLGLQNTPPSIGEDEYRIVQKVALDSCVGWNLDTVSELARMDGLTLNEIAEYGRIPKSTLRDRLEDLCMLGVLEKERNPGRLTGPGAPPVRYHTAAIVRQFWEGAGMNGAIPGRLSGPVSELRPLSARKPGSGIKTDSNGGLGRVRERRKFVAPKEEPQKSRESGRRKLKAPKRI